jgi:hypothetical protein
MFRDSLSLHYTGSSNQTETNGEVVTAVTHVKLVMDTFTPAIAKSLSRDVHDLCFDKDGRIHDQLSKITVRLREPQQAVTARMARDAGVHVELRHVRVPTLVITKRGEDKGDEVERKSKKIAPTAETLRATLNCLMLPESDASRRFLCTMAGKTFFFEFEDEEKQLDFGPDEDDEDEDEDDENQGELNIDDKPARGRRRAAKVETDGLTDEAIAEALSQVGVELKPKQLAALTAAQRSETVQWIGEYQRARERNEPVLPSMPSYIFNPAELEEAGDVMEEQEAAIPPSTSKAQRAPRRSSSKFKNGPRLVGKKKGRK